MTSRTNMLSDFPAGRFFVLVFLFSVPFWAAGFLFKRFAEEMPIDLPASAFMALVPGAVAIFLVRRDLGRERLLDFLHAAFAVGQPGKGVWYAVAFGFAPVAIILSYILLLITGAPLPVTHLPLDVVPIFFVLFLIGALGEELGWQAYAYGPLRTRWTALQSALILGVIWMTWHLIPYFQTGHDIWWIVSQCLVILMMRVIIVWIFVNAGNSTAAAVLFHAMSNMGVFLFPNYGTHYNPLALALVLAPAVAAILFLWDAGTLSRYRFAERP
ncbi:MAG: CPBP family glutamic-type intramembrane protease [Parvibaculaceae bacterium]